MYWTIMHAHNNKKCALEFTRYLKKTALKGCMMKISIYILDKYYFNVVLCLIKNRIFLPGEGWCKDGHSCRVLQS